MSQDAIGRVSSRRAASVWFVPLSGMLAPLLVWCVLVTATTASFDAGSAPAESAAQGHEQEPDEIEVPFEISGLRADAGQLYVAVFGGATGFPNTERAEQTHQLKVQGDRMLILLRLRPGEPQAVAAFQDLDGNSRLSKNLLGIPVEPYGFSRNARGALGPPKFDNAAIVLPAEADELSIRLK